MHCDWESRALVITSAVRQSLHNQVNDKVWKKKPKENRKKIIMKIKKELRFSRQWRHVVGINLVVSE
jgi:hypothetical protein